MHNFKGTCFSTENSVGKEAWSLEVKINSIIDWSFWLITDNWFFNFFGEKSLNFCPIFNNFYQKMTLKPSRNVETFQK